MKILTLEVEDDGCAVDDMDKMDVFALLCSESEGMELWEGEKGYKVGIDGRVEDADRRLKTPHEVADQQRI